MYSAWVARSLLGSRSRPEALLPPLKLPPKPPDASPPLSVDKFLNNARCYWDLSAASAQTRSSGASREAGYTNCPRSRDDSPHAACSFALPRVVAKAVALVVDAMTTLVLYLSSILSRLTAVVSSSLRRAPPPPRRASFPSPPPPPSAPTDETGEQAARTTRPSRGWQPVRSYTNISISKLWLLFLIITSQYPLLGSRWTQHYLDWPPPPSSMPATTAVVVYQPAPPPPSPCFAMLSAAGHPPRGSARRRAPAPSAAPAAVVGSAAVAPTVTWTRPSRSRSRSRLSLRSPCSRLPPTRPWLLTRPKRPPRRRWTWTRTRPPSRASGGGRLPAAPHPPPRSRCVRSSHAHPRHVCCDTCSDARFLSDAAASSWHITGAAPAAAAA